MADEPDLFDVKRRKPRTKKPSVNGAVGRLLGVHRAFHEQRFDEQPLITEKDAALLKALIAKFGESVVEDRLRLYHRLDDRFVADAGYALSLFCTSTQWARLTAAARQREAGEKAGPPSAAKTDEYLRRLRKGNGRG